MATCSVHGTKTKGLFGKCGLCEQENTISLNLKSKIPLRPIEEPEEDE